MLPLWSKILHCQENRHVRALGLNPNNKDGRIIFLIKLLYFTNDISVSDCVNHLYSLGLYNSSNLSSFGNSHYSVRKFCYIWQLNDIFKLLLFKSINQHLIHSFITYQFKILILEMGSQLFFKTAYTPPQNTTVNWIHWNRWNHIN